MRCGLDWNDVVPAAQLSYIMGNPPFVGAKFMDDNQRTDVSLVFGDIKNAGLLDFVAAWYVKAARMMQGTTIRCAFVSTNSITQGEQVGVLWSWMLAQGIKIFFAHRTFSWNSEAKGKAAVHCVIVGFAAEDISPKWLFEYEHIKGEAHLLQAKNINPYLVDAPNALLSNIKKPICNVTPIIFGNMPNDGGGLLLSEDEKRDMLLKEPDAKPWIRQFLGAEEFINKKNRWCLWLNKISPSELKSLETIKKRVESVKKHRSESTRKTTLELASTPTLFGEIRQPENSYILVPRHSSESRTYIPCGFIEPSIICGDSNMLIPGASLYEFGIINSLTHNAWMRTVCGRLESRYRYSAGIVYNNFPWPENPNEKQTQTIETAAQAVLDARAQFPDASLADLYDPLTMPPVLLKAHQTLDKAVDAAYGKTNFKTEAERVAFLFELYQKYTSLLPVEKPKKVRKPIHEGA
jgi:hypothetical protein